MNFGYQGTSRVHYSQAASARMVPFAWRHAVCAEDNALALRHLVEVLDKDRALTLECFKHEPVMHDLMTYVERRTVSPQGAPHSFDSAIDARAKATRLSQDDFFNRGVVREHVVDLVQVDWPLWPGAAAMSAMHRTPFIQFSILYADDL
jgi:hypothetical protein